MSAGNDVNITLKARTDEFETKFKRAIGVFDDAARKGKELNSSLNAEFKQINQAATKFVGDIGKSFSALQIKTDFSLGNQKRALEENVKFFKAQYYKIARDGNSSAKEIERAFLGMNEKLQSLHFKFNETSNSTKTISDLHAEALAVNKKYNADRLIEQQKTDKLALESKRQYFKSVANLHNETMSLEKGMEKLKLDGIAAGNKARAEQIAAGNKARAEQIAIDKKFSNELLVSRQKINDKLVDSVIAAKKKEQEVTAVTVAKEISAYKEAYAKISSYRLNDTLGKLTGGNLAGSDFSSGLKDRLEREQGLLISRIGLIRETMSLENGLADIKNKAAIAAEKLRNKERVATEQRITDLNKLRIAEQANLNKLRIAEQAKYRSQAMSDNGSAAKLIGQLQAGSKFAEQLKSQMQGVEKPISNAADKMNLFGLASIGAILKIQILYSLVNQVMSAIGSVPGIAIDAVENYNASIIANAALITSMQKGVKDIGRAYQENKKYAQGVQDVLIKMDAETAASGQNLTDMNRKFVEQGVLININNKKQVDGFRNIANAISALTSGQPNANMQYSQEISAMLRGENRPTNKLFQMLNNIDNGKLAEHLELWKKIGIEQNNSGYILEKLGPMLNGFAAAQGDINMLWETTKSTLVTIRDQVLRAGFAPEFEILVKKMKELGVAAEENKVKIAAMMRQGFSGINNVVVNVSSIVSDLSFLAKPILWTTIGAGVVTLTGGIVTMATAITAATGGLNLLMAAAVGAGLFVLKDFDDRLTKFKNIKATLNSTLSSHGVSLPGSDLMIPAHGSVSVPTVSGSDEKTEAEKKAEKAAARAIKLNEKFQLKLAAVQKSGNEIRLVEQEAARVIELELNEQAHSQNIIGEQAFIAKRQQINEKELKLEIETRENTLKAYQDLLKGTFSAGVEGDKQRAEVKIKINEANKELIKSEKQLELLRVKNDGERKNFLIKEEEYLRSIKERVLDMVGSHVEAETVRQNSLSNTIEKFRLLRDVINEVKGASEAASGFLFENGQAAANALNAQLQRKLDTVNSSTNSRMSVIGDSGLVSNAYNIEIEHSSEQILLNNNLEAIKGNSKEELALQKELNDKKHESDLLYATQKKALDMEVASNAISVLKEMGGKSRTVQLIALGLEKALALTRIMMNTEVAASAAMAAQAILGPAAAAAAAAAVRSAGYVSMGLVAASTIMETYQIAEGRQSGGPVTAGRSYVVGEKRPELFTPGASGVITPYVPSGGAPQEVRVVIENKGADKKVVSAKPSFDLKGMIVSVMLDDFNSRGPYARTLAGGV